MTKLPIPEDFLEEMSSLEINGSKGESYIFSCEEDNDICQESQLTKK